MHNSGLTLELSTLSFEDAGLGWEVPDLSIITRQI